MYTKPKVVALGKAVRMIGFLGMKQFRFPFDAFLLGINPAYDLDE